MRESTICSSRNARPLSVSSRMILKILWWKTSKISITTAAVDFTRAIAIKSIPHAAQQATTCSNPISTSMPNLTSRPCAVFKVISIKDNSRWTKVQLTSIGEIDFKQVGNDIALRVQTRILHSLCGPDLKIDTHTTHSAVINSKRQSGKGKSRLRSCSTP